MTARLTASAIHESGHVCACIALRVPFRKVDIIPQQDRLGHVYDRKSRATFPNDRTDPRVIDWVERNIIVDFAGGLAQRHFAPRSHWSRGMGHDGFVRGLYYDDDQPITYHVKTGYGSDLRHIDEWLKYLGRYGDDAYRAALEQRAAALVKKLFPEIKRVARALLEHKTLTQAQVRQLMKRTAARR
jgi:hypothetical protein